MKARIFMLIGLLLIIIPTLSLQAQIPQTLSYQGVLTDENGNPLPDGQYSMLFALYISSIGGTAIWSETKSLELSGGLFNTYLGDQTEFGNGVLFNKQYWLGITVESEPEMTDRIALSSAAYSINSLKADTAMTANSVISSAILDVKGINAVTLLGNSPGRFKQDHTTATASALIVDNAGLGYGARIDNISDDVSKAALRARTFGQGYAGQFEILNNSNDKPALFVKTAGVGDAGYFEGDITVTGVATAQSHVSTSDIKFKKDIVSIESPLEKVLKLRGVRFRWKINDFPEMDFEEGDQIGFIAQEVETILPEIVATNRDGNKSVDYSKVAAVLVEAVKEQQSLINDLNKRIKRLEENLSNHALVKMDAETFKFTLEGLN